MAGQYSQGREFLSDALAYTYEMRWRAEGDEPFQVMHLYLSVPLFDRVATEILGDAASTMRLRNISGGRDQQLSNMLGLIYAELTAEGHGGQLFIEGLAQTLAVHLIRQYATYDAEARPSNALPGAKLRRVITFMEANLQEPFDLTRLAQTAGMSAFHFSRLFKTATGLSPSRYFIRQRIARAQQMLQEADTSIIEIGMSVGYSSPSHFAQVFRREVGVSPSDYRQS
jgi:AraC family transcriptional regulator